MRTHAKQLVHAHLSVPAARSAIKAAALRSAASWARPMTLNALRTFMNVARMEFTSMAATLVS